MTVVSGPQGGWVGDGSATVATQSGRVGDLQVDAWWGVPEEK